MSDSVTCTRCGQTAPAITGFIGFHGDLKERIRANACAPCWQEWLGYQLMAINEYRLNLGTEAHRAILGQLVSEFLKLPGAVAGDESTPSIAHIETVRTPEKE